MLDTIAAILKEAEKHEREAAELCERHAANYPDNADYWKHQSERHRAAKFEIMNYEEFTRRQREKLPTLLSEEKELTEWLYRLAASDARIGYEASNHYYFTQNSFLEKLINLDQLMREL